MCLTSLINRERLWKPLQLEIGRYPQLLVQLARMIKVHIIGCTGFWCEASSPQHPWPLTMSLKRGGVNEMTKLFVREITEGMENPRSGWGENYTIVRAGAIKIGTSFYLRPSERQSTKQLQLRIGKKVVQF